jgi:hypothetical protein
MHQTNLPVPPVIVPPIPPVIVPVPPGPYINRLNINLNTLTMKQKTRLNFYYLIKKANKLHICFNQYKNIQKNQHSIMPFITGKETEKEKRQNIMQKLHMILDFPKSQMICN